MRTMVIRSLILGFALLLHVVAQPRRSAGFLIHTLNGAAIDVTNYAGKVVIIEFLLTTCSHCQHLATVLKKVQSEYGPERLRDHVVRVDASTESVLADVRQHVNGVGLQDDATVILVRA